MAEKQPRGMLQRPFDALASVVVPAVADAVDPDDLVDRIDVNALIGRIDVDALVERIDVAALVERVDLNALLMKVDVDAVLERVDLDAVLKRVDLDQLLARIDVDAIVDRVDIQRAVARLDLDAIVDQVDVERVVSRVDVEAVVARVDLNAAADRIDVERVLDRVDLDGVVARVDLNAAADRIDVQRVVDRVDLDDIAASMDIDAIVARSTRGVFERFVDLLRRQVVGVDEVAMRTIARLLRRDPATLPAGPPLLVDSGTTSATMTGRYAGPVSRFGALTLDSFVISATFALLWAGASYLVSVLFGGGGLPEDSWAPAVLVVAYGFVYFWISLAVTGRTIAQSLVGLKVVRADGDVLGPGAAAVRTVVLPFSFMLLGIGALMALVDRRRRSLHDVVARSAVVYDWGDRPAALPAPLTRFIERRDVRFGAAATRTES
jgi:uncharacterized RDD family membrane protein YckC